MLNIHSITCNNQITIENETFNISSPKNNQNNIAEQGTSTPKNKSTISNTERMFFLQNTPYIKKSQTKISMYNMIKTNSNAKHRQKLEFFDQSMTPNKKKLSKLARYQPNLMKIDSFINEESLSTQFDVKNKITNFNTKFDFNQNQQKENNEPLNTMFGNFDQSQFDKNISLLPQKENSGYQDLTNQYFLYDEEIQVFMNFFEYFNSENPEILNLFDQNSQFEIIGYPLMALQNTLQILISQCKHFKVNFQTPKLTLQQKQDTSELIITYTNGEIIPKDGSIQPYEFIMSSKIDKTTNSDSSKMLNTKLKIIPKSQIN